MEKSILKNNFITKIWKFLHKVFTQNYCDTCGFTKDKVYVTHHFTEAGFIQCKKCYEKE